MGANLARNIARRGVPIAVHNRTTAKTTEFMEEYGHEGTFTGCETTEDFVAALETPAADHRDGQGGRAGGRRDRGAHPAARRGRHHHRRRQLALPRHRAAHRGVRRERAPLHGRRRVRRRGGRAARAEHHARRRPGRLRRGRGDPHRDRRRRRRHAVLRARRPGRRRATTSRWCTTASSTPTSSSSPRRTTCSPTSPGSDAPAIGKIFEEWNTGDLESFLIEITAKVLAEDRRRRPAGRSST